MTEHSRTYSWEDPTPYVKRGLAMAGLDYMQKIIAGEFPQPPIAKTMGFHLVKVAHGYAMFECEPQDFHYNPLGVVHGGLAATLLDSALGCCIHTTMEEGTGYTTIQLNVNMVRALQKDTGIVKVEGRVLHRGRKMATAEATLTDVNGKVYAHGTTTCFVFALPQG